MDDIEFAHPQNLGRHRRGCCGSEQRDYPQRRGREQAREETLPGHYLGLDWTKPFLFPGLDRMGYPG